MVIHAAVRAIRLGQSLAGRSTQKLTRKCQGQTQENHAPIHAPCHAVSVDCIISRNVVPTEMKRFVLFA